MTAGLDYMMPSTFAQVAKPFLQQQAGVIDDWEFFRGLGLRMGKTAHMRRPFFGVAHRDIPGPEIALTAERTAEELIRWMVDAGVGRYEEVEANPHGLLFAAAAKIIEPADPGDNAKLDLCPPDIAEDIRKVRATEDEAAGFAYRLIPRRMIEVMNSAYTNASQTRLRSPTNPIFMNDDDMARLSIENGGEVRHPGRVASSSAKSGKTPDCVRASSPCVTARATPLSPVWEDPDAFSGRLVSLIRTLNRSTSCLGKAGFRLTLNDTTV